MKLIYDKNECGYRCVAETREPVEFMGRCIPTLKRGISIERHPTKGLAKLDALRQLAPVLA